jgi:2',3'-cyclic-nucleotide 2'-phosphodiesterase (5'-nucleotidase family)
VAINHNVRSIAQKMVDDGVVDLDLNGHNHDLWLFFNGRSAGVESGSDAHYVTSVDIAFDVSENDGKRSVKWWPDFRVTDTASLEPDAEVAAKVAAYESELDTELGVELGTTAVELDSRKASVRSQGTMMGNLVADGMRNAVGADIAITNGGGIRGDKVYEAGTKLTRKDILAELPFGNKTLMIALMGAEVKQALENGVSQIEQGAGRFPQVSGLTFAVDTSRPAGERVSDIMVNGAPLDMAAKYKVATNDFMARGGDGYLAFKSGELLVNAESAKLMANDVMSYVRQLGEVTSTEQRITIK